MVADRYIRNFSRLGQGILPTQNALPKYFGFFKETERRVCWQEKKETDTGFQEAEVGVHCLAFFFRRLVKCRAFVSLSMLLSALFHILGCCLETAISQC